MASPNKAGILPLTEHPDMMAMTDVLAAEVEGLLAQAIADRGAAVLAVSGGSTPAPLYRRLANAPLDWSRVTVVLVDERWVDAGMAGSNESFVRETLLTGAAADAAFVRLKTPADSPLYAVDEVEARLQGLPHTLDVAILGMGVDGHTASWFPRARGLDRALSRSGGLVAAIQADRTDVTGPHTERMTLTFAALAEAKRLILLINGAAKRETLLQAAKDGPVVDMPVRALLRDTALPLDIHWTE